jgi:hypothetical protein
VDRRQREAEAEQVRVDVADMARKAREATLRRITAQQQGD